MGTKNKAQNIEFRVADATDFYSEFGGVKTRYIGKDYWLLNQSNFLEKYTLNEDSDTAVLLDQINEQKIYLPIQQL